MASHLHTKGMTGKWVGLLSVPDCCSRDMHSKWYHTEPRVEKAACNRAFKQAEEWDFGSNGSLPRPHHTKLHAEYKVPQTALNEITDEITDAITVEVSGHNRATILDGILCMWQSDSNFCSTTQRQSSRIKQMAITENPAPNSQHHNLNHDFKSTSKSPSRKAG